MAEDAIVSSVWTVKLFENGFRLIPEDLPTIDEIETAKEVYKVSLYRLFHMRFGYVQWARGKSRLLVLRGLYMRGLRETSVSCSHHINQLKIDFL